MELTENIILPERAVLVAVDTGEYDVETSLSELAELAKTAGAEALAKLTQKRQKPDSATFIGSGRLEELRVFCADGDIDLLIFDSELSPSQQRNIEQETDVRVIDRTTLILDIFAAHARSGEGKLQVEIAQLKYALPRLGGKGTQLSRLGGGIGTRGPGETKLETDRRHIRGRIRNLENELAELKKRRDLARARRQKDGVVTVAIIGYTNAGKSTLMNALTQADVLTEDKLFVTLDPTSRALTLPSGRKVMLIDTVGLIRRLPHKLVEAFLSTLEEAASADLVLNMCDASSDDFEEHLMVACDLLRELECENKKIISVLNKCDAVENVYSLPCVENSVMISALNGTGLDALLEKIDRELPPTRRQGQLLFPYPMGHAVARFRDDGIILSEEYKENGVYIEVIADINLLRQYKDYEC
ncbi:MAG: GTPase HflX [Oscillospiraceae bacterium]|nr:GTPase HflX [Oscillospiraceae bacterium]